MRNYFRLAISKVYLYIFIIIWSTVSGAVGACQTSKQVGKTMRDSIKLITLDPGHFHAALVQKYMYPGVSSTVHVYAPNGPELNAHLKLVDKYNTRAAEPTKWNEQVHRGPDYLDKLLSEKKGNVVIVAGNNKRKADYIINCVNAGLNVLADKPMAINKEGFTKLEKAFEIARSKGVLLYDIMTERYEINSLLQKEFSQQKALFGTLVKGTPDNPAITKESVHHFFKYVSGAPLVRPAWYYDVRQQAEGLVDVTTHLVDLVQWECFPGEAINYKKDINVLAATRWATAITPFQYKLSTTLSTYPDYLKADITDSTLNVYANGEMNYTIKGVHAKVSVRWDFQAPAGSGDTHFSIIRGTKANVIIRQGKAQDYKPVLYIEQLGKEQGFEEVLKQTIASLQSRYPGLAYKLVAEGWQITVPESFNVGHEEHFAQVTRAYLKYLRDGKLPVWEVPNMLAKYYTTTMALENAKTVKK